MKLLQNLVRLSSQSNPDVARSIRAGGADMKRVNIRAILADPIKRRKLLVRAIIAAQAAEGIETTQEQAELAYDTVQREKLSGKGGTDVKTC